MNEDIITEVGIDAQGRLYVCPAAAEFPYVYRAAMEVNWDKQTRRLFGPKPRHWSYADWFKQIVAAASDEYGTHLRLNADTVFVNVPTPLRAEIESYSEQN